MEKRTTQILQYINKNAGCRVQDVTEHLGLSRPLTSAILKSMEELGLIKRDFGEGRAVILKITERGKEVLNNDK
jgi:DNA-binding MarR family transcriptional regulator